MYSLSFRRSIIPPNEGTKVTKTEVISLTTSHHCHTFLFSVSETTTNPPVVCGGSYSTQGGASGSFSSPGFPGRYPPSIRCTWTVTADPGSVVLLGLEQFQLENNCAYDRVSFYDGTISESFRNSRVRFSRSVSRKGFFLPEPHNVRR